MTEQVQERIILKGKGSEMITFPDLPKDDPRITEIPALCAEMNESTNCYRNYIGTWEIDAGTLYLVKLEGKYRLKKRYGLFPAKKIFADWYSGTIVIPDGDNTVRPSGEDLVHAIETAVSGHDVSSIDIPPASEEIHIVVQNGIVTKSTRVTSNSNELN